MRGTVGYALQHAGEAYSAPPDPLAGFEGPTSKGRRRGKKGGDERGGRRRKEGRGEGRGGKRRERRGGLSSNVAEEVSALDPPLCRS